MYFHGNGFPIFLEFGSLLCEAKILFRQTQWQCLQGSQCQTTEEVGGEGILPGCIH